MNIKKSIVWTTRTAVFVALLVILQVATGPLGNILLTGSLVNAVLIVSVMTCGLSSGLCAAVMSPILAKLVGIGPLWALIPFIAAGNAVLVLCWRLVGHSNGGVRNYTVAVPVAAAAKFLTLYVGIVQIALPLFLHPPEKQVAVISSMFSLPQLMTALVGGSIVALLLPRLMDR